MNPALVIGSLHRSRVIPAHAAGDCLYALDWAPLPYFESFLIQGNGWPACPGPGRRPLIRRSRRSPRVFLGMGVKPPTPSWGSILNDGFSLIRNTPWPIIAGSIPLVLATLGFTFLGESLRDLLDPKLRKLV